MEHQKGIPPHHTGALQDVLVDGVPKIPRFETDSPLSTEAKLAGSVEAQELVAEERWVHEDSPTSMTKKMKTMPRTTPLVDVGYK